MEDTRTVFRRFKEQVEKSTYQKELHFNNDGDSTVIRTHFLNAKRKETWTYRENLKLDCQGDISNPDFINYRVKTVPYHGLLYTVLKQELPMISAEPGYEICWCPNIGTNIVRSGSLAVNDTQWYDLNCNYVDHFIQKECTDVDIDRDIGNVAALQRWSTTLPSFETMFWLPWVYSRDSSKMFPLYMCGKNDTVVHKMYLCRYIGELLMIRKTGTNELVEFNESYIRIHGNTVIGGTSPYILPVPEMRGEYVMMSDMECEYNRCGGNNAEHASNVFDIDNIRAIESDNTHTLGTTVSLKIKDMPFPVHTIHWCAVNLNAKARNYLSNYTTNSQDHLSGGNPIKWITLSTPNGLIFKNQDFSIGERLVSKKNFKRTPRDPGYGCWTNAPDACSPLYPKPGIKLDDSEITFRLENLNYPSNDNFKINVQVVYSYRITIKDYPKNEAERNVKGIEFDISGDM